MFDLELSIILKNLSPAHPFAPHRNWHHFLLQGKKVFGDLLPNGKIAWENQQYVSPSLWATVVKKNINPNKKSGCGWNSVKYKVLFVLLLKRLVFLTLDEMIVLRQT